MSPADAQAWNALDRELDRWAAAGRRATLWWRDDDAVAPTGALDRLLGIAAAQGAALALAVIPAGASPALAARLDAHPAPVAVLQHGFAHVSHAPSGEKKAELGAHRPPRAVLDELAAGNRRLSALFGETGVKALPVLVPPWNRIAETVVAGLPGAGFAGLSTYGPRPRRHAAPGLLQVNTHADIVDWRGSRGFLGEAAAIGLLVGHLRMRRSGAVDAEEPTGLITHHLVHDAACWSFCTRLAARVAAHPAACWLDAASLFNMPPNRGLDTNDARPRHGE
ncbi:MAG: polysaccharide deacetylase [Alphaproteobacteria bacterium]|nr:MAG: polysaccharide deacetylase [Alphaproteobacteria bacterium]